MSQIYETNKEMSNWCGSFQSTQPTNANVENANAQVVDSPLSSYDEKCTASKIQQDIESEEIFASKYDIKATKINMSLCESSERNSENSVYSYSTNNQTNLKFIGRIDDSGLRQGYGVMIYKNGQSYAGQWLDDKKQGYGVYNFSGQHFMYEKYEGQFVENKFSGNGKLTYCDQSLYTGQFEGNQKNGIGVFMYSDQDDTYISYNGDWKSDSKHGHGILKFIDGSTYTGNFKENFIHGKGKMIWDYNSSDQIFSAYEGQFYKGSFEGNGKMRYQNDDTYIGKWKNNVFDGFGEYKCSSKSNTNCLNLPNSFTRIEGSFKNGQINGVCKVFLKNGNIVMADYQLTNKEKILNIEEETYKGIIFYSETERNKFKLKNVGSFQGQIKGFQEYGMGKLMHKNKSKVISKGNFNQSTFVKSTANFKDDTNYEN